MHAALRSAGCASGARRASGAVATAHVSATAKLRKKRTTFRISSGLKSARKRAWLWRRGTTGRSRVCRSRPRGGERRRVQDRRRARYDLWMRRPAISSTFTLIDDDAHDALLLRHERRCDCDAVIRAALNKGARAASSAGSAINTTAHLSCVRYERCIGDLIVRLHDRRAKWAGDVCVRMRARLRSRRRRRLDRAARARSSSCRRTARPRAR